MEKLNIRYRKRIKIFHFFFSVYDFLFDIEPIFFSRVSKRHAKFIQISLILCKRKKIKINKSAALLSGVARRKLLNKKNILR